jgi:hypothetical protein
MVCGEFHINKLYREHLALGRPRPPFVPALSTLAFSKHIFVAADKVAGRLQGAGHSLSMKSRSGQPADSIVTMSFS